MSATTLLARSQLRAHAPSHAGVLVVAALAAALSSASWAWVDLGMRQAQFSQLSQIAGSFAGTALLIVVMVVASSTTASLRTRNREVALLRIIGATDRQVRALVRTEVLILFAVAAVPGIVAGLLLARWSLPWLAAAGLVPPGGHIGTHVLAVPAALLVLIPTGVIAAHLAVRPTLRLSPARAIAQATTDTGEARRIGPARRISGTCSLALGLLIAAAPFAAPGVVGSAAGASSVIALLVAATCFAPALIATTTDRLHRLAAPAGGAIRLLGIRGLRGYSRRVAVAVVPLALLFSLGLVQSGLNDFATIAAGRQIAADVNADLVTHVSSGTTTHAAEQAVSDPGIEAAGSMATTRTRLKVDRDDDAPAVFASLSWENVQVRSIPVEGHLIDPRVTRGSLADLQSEGTIAVSRSALLGSGNNLGGPVTVRAASGADISLRIVAVYEDGLGLGDYLVGPATMHQVDPLATADTLVIRTKKGAGHAVRRRIARLGFRPMSVAQYARHAVASSAAQARLSLWSLLLLLGFVALAAANTLGMLVASRRREFGLLRSIGATRRQVIGAIAVEAALTAAIALALGGFAALPALIGAGYGLLGAAAPPVGLAVTGGLAAVVVLVAVPTMTIVAWRTTRSTAATG